MNSRRGIPRRSVLLLSRLGAAVLLIAVIGGACGSDDAQAPTVFAEGLINPVGLAALPTGGLLVAEEGTGENDDSAAVSMISNGRVDRILTGLPSSRDSGDLSGVPMVGLSPDGTTVYTAHFGSEALLTFPLPSKKAVDAGIVFGIDDLERTMEPLNRVRMTNPFDITFAPDGSPVVADASENGVAMRTPDGKTSFIHRFGKLEEPGGGPLEIDAVPTGITRLDDEYLVTLTGGCPYPEGSGRLVAIDGEQGERVIADGLNMPIDVTVGPDGSIWLLEFAKFDADASCFSAEGYLPGTGRLSLVDGDKVIPVVENLDFPGSVVATDDGSLYVTEIFAGRVLRLDPAGSSVSSESPAEAASPWFFTDVAADLGVDFTHGAFAQRLSADPVAMMGGGLCWLDADGDLDLDLYLVNSHATAEAEVWLAGEGLPTNQLFENRGTSEETGFVDISVSSGTDLAMRGNGCIAADFDGDADTDIYVTADGPNALLINDGSGHFVDRAVEAGVAADEWSTAAAAGDVDGDGYVDLFVGSYINLERTIEKPSGAFPQDYPGVPNHLYISNGDGTFTDRVGAAGVVNDDRTLGAVLSDLDEDGDLDLYVANDGQPNSLYENVSTTGEVSFDGATLTGSASDSGSGMGVASGDYDGDGRTDLMVTNWEAELHAIYRSAGPGLDFTYSTSRIGYAGLGNGTTGWGTAWADLDNDTDLDLLIANGRVPVTDLGTDPELVELFGNLAAEGEPGQLRDWTQRAGLEAVGPRLSRGAALADFDDDGDLDIAINQIAGPAVLLRNESPPGSHLTVVAEPATPGTRANVLLSDGRVLEREIIAGSSYLSSEDPRLHFGLGSETIVQVTVTWPDGTEILRSDVRANTSISVAAE